MRLSAACERWRAARRASVARLDVVMHSAPPAFTQRSQKASTTAGIVRMFRAAGVARRRKRLPRQAMPIHIEQAYAKELRKILARLRAALQPLLRKLPALLESAARERRDDARMDAGEGKQVRELVQGARDTMAESVATGAIDDLARVFAEQTARYQRMQLTKQLHAALGVDPFIQDARLEPLTEAFVDANVGLIGNLTDKVAAEIESLVLRGMQEGTLHEDLAAQIEERFRIGESRAQLVARDQIGKIYGDVNASRQRNLGIERFIWRTSLDERVRDEHQELEGEIFSYDDPPAEGLPGFPISCRCYAEPVLDDIIDESGAGDEEPVDEG